MSEWISVKDELPEVDKDVLLFTNTSRIYVGSRVVGNKLQKPRWDIPFMPFVKLYFGGDFITHWMPLPEPPKDIKEN